jgi:hypothetical protein
MDKTKGMSKDPERSDENLVMFPASKNFIVRPREEDLQDPLEELLHEFDGIFDPEDSQWHELEEQDEEGADEELELELAKELGRTKEALATPQVQASSHDFLKKTELLIEAHERLKYYLDELESVLLPRNN